MGDLVYGLRCDALLGMICFPEFKQTNFAQSIAQSSRQKVFKNRLIGFITFAFFEKT